MEPKTRDFVGAGLLALVLLMLMAMLALAGMPG